MKIFLSTLVLVVALIFPTQVLASESYWQIQSVDTMKYSRDLARDRESDSEFEKIITSQMKSIASTGANYVSIGTPYDKEFTPLIKKWVKAARDNRLKVWFRGNFSGWEEWFGYEKISREEHQKLLENFILSNPGLFENGDVFSPCTECENGGPGDPRDTGDVAGYRDFLINEYQIAKSAFEKIGKNVSYNYFSMNWDVAYLVMDKKTTSALGGIVVVDHYVKDPEQLSKDVETIAERSGGKVILGEFGVPIPDINGEMTEYQQALWIDEALRELSNDKDLLGVNYWTSFGGTTNIWNDDGSKRSPVDVITSYYSPDIIEGSVVNEIGRPLAGVKIASNSKITMTDKLGNFGIQLIPSTDTVFLKAEGYKDKMLTVQDLKSLGTITLEKAKESLFFRFQKWIYRILNRFSNI